MSEKKESKFMRCGNCGCPLFKIIISRIGEYGEYIDYKCVNCKEVSTGIIHDPFMERKKNE